MSIDALRALASRLKIAEDDLMRRARDLARRVVGPHGAMPDDVTAPDRSE